MRAARLRRNMTAVDCARRVGISRDTLSRLAGGDDSIALGTYVRALRVLGLDGDLDALARDDVLGRKLQDLRLPAKRSRMPPAAADAPPPVSP